MIDVALVFLLLTLKGFHALFFCFHCLLCTSKCQLGYRVLTKLLSQQCLMSISKKYQVIPIVTMTTSSNQLLPAKRVLTCEEILKNLILYTILQHNCPEVFCKKDVFRNFAKRHLCQSLFFNKVAGLKPATLLKKRLWHRCFPVNFAKFLRTPLLTEHLRWLHFFELHMQFTCKV